MVEPNTQGKGLLGIGYLKPLPVVATEYVPETNSKGNPVYSQTTVQTYSIFFAQYENTYIPAGDEKLYSFVVVRTLGPITSSDCATQLGMKQTNVYGLTQTQYENRMLPMPPYPNFSTYLGQTGGTAISLGGTVGFLDLSVRNPTTVQPTAWLWNFGGTGACAGSTGATAQNPLVSFGATGSYTVTLTATNANGSTSITKSNFVTVS